MADTGIYDKYGSYFYRDLRVNVAALAILRVRHILPHVDPRGITDATEARATLFPRTPFAVEVCATRDTLVVIRPDLSTVSFSLQPDDVRDILGRLREAMERPAGKLSLVALIHAWAAEYGRTELVELLEQYGAEREAEPFVPTSGPGAATRGAGKG